MRIRKGWGRDAEKGISGSVCALACAKRSPAAARGRPRPSGHPSSRQCSALPRASLDCGTSCVARTPGP